MAIDRFLLTRRLSVGMAMLAITTGIAQKSAADRLPGFGPTNNLWANQFYHVATQGLVERGLIHEPQRFLAIHPPDGGDFNHAYRQVRNGMLSGLMHNKRRALFTGGALGGGLWLGFQSYLVGALGAIGGFGILPALDRFAYGHAAIRAWMTFKNLYRDRAQAYQNAYMYATDAATRDELINFCYATPAVVEQVKGMEGRVAIGQMVAAVLDLLQDVATGPEAMAKRLVKLGVDPHQAKEMAEARHPKLKYTTPEIVGALRRLPPTAKKAAWGEHVDTMEHIFRRFAGDQRLAEVVEKLASNGCSLESVKANFPDEYQTACQILVDHTFNHSLGLALMFEDHDPVGRSGGSLASSRGVLNGITRLGDNVGSYGGVKSIDDKDILTVIAKEHIGSGLFLEAQRGLALITGNVGSHAVERGTALVYAQGTVGLNAGLQMTDERFPAGIFSVGGFEEEAFQDFSGLMLALNQNSFISQPPRAVRYLAGKKVFDEALKKPPGQQRVKEALDIFAEYLQVWEPWTP